MPDARRRFVATFGVLAIPDVRRLWISQALSEIGDWAARLALAVLVYDRSGSALWSAATLAVSYLPYLLSPILTSVAQRWSLRRMLVGADLVRMALYALIALPLPTWALLVMAFTAALATPPYEAARVAVTPEASGEERMGDAFALANVTFQMAQVVGFGVAGLLIYLVGAEAAILVNAASFGISAVLVFRLRAGRHLPDPEPALTRTRRALHEATHNRLLRRILTLVVLLALADAAVNALLPVFVRSNHFNPLLLTVLASCAPLVGAMSGTVVPREGDNAHLLRVAATLTLAGGVGAGVLFLVVGTGSTSWSALLAVIAMVAFGLTIAADIPTMTAAMRLVDQEQRASLVALVQPALMGVQAVGALTAGVLALVLTATTTMAFLLVIPVLYAVWVLMRSPTSTARHRGSRAGEGPHMPPPDSSLP